MDCPLIEADLLAYHFATLGDDARARTDAHLLACTACLRAYLALKHHLDRGGASAERPRPEARRKLRDAVEATFGPRTRADVRVRRFLGRPIPLYQGLAAAAFAVLVATLVPAVLHAPARDAAPHARPHAEGEHVDSSRPVAESLTIY